MDGTLFDFLPIKPDMELKQVDKGKRKLLFRYHPYRVRSVKPEILRKELYDKYTEISSSINSMYNQIKDTWDTVGRFMPEIKKLYEIYVDGYISLLHALPDSSLLVVILEANDLETTGSRNQLEDRIIDNVPIAIASLNIDEHVLRQTHTPKIEDTLKEFPENKLVRILELKNINAVGDSFSIIKQIVSSITEDEINNLIDQVDGEINDLRAKLNRLNDKQLKLILDNNNLNSYGNKNQLITKIIETLPISDIENNINKVTINKEKALKKLYSITGKDELSKSFKKRLADNNLEIEHGIEIRNKIAHKIKNYEIEEKEIESQLDRFIKRKSQKVTEDILNELYKLTGEKSLNKKFLDKLKKSGLDEKDGIKIKNEIITDIKEGKVKKDDLKDLIDLKVQDKKIELENEKLDILYKITGKTNINSSFKKLLSEHDLDEQDGLNIKNELITLIKTTIIGKKDINPKLLELITLAASEKLINKCDMSYLNQIAIMNNLSKCDTKQKYVKYFLDNISPSFNDFKIKSAISEIDNIKERLDKLYKNQLEFILISNNVPNKGTKKEVINNIVSNIHIDAIKLIISEIDKINKQLNQLTLNEISFIVKENNIKVGGTKDKLINEINKTVSIDTIKKDIKRLNEIKSQLNDFNINELKFIAKSNNLSVTDNNDDLIDAIETQVPVAVISENISEISNIKNLVQSFNDIQRQHLLITNDLNINSDDKTQISEILENVDLFEISEFNKSLVELKEELDDLSVIQLNHILNNHNLETSTDKSIQINTILDNILIPFIKKDIQTIKSFENKINDISEDEIDSILAENKLRKSVDKESNIKTIVENLSFDEINSYLSETKNDVNTIDEIKDSALICPIKIAKGKKTLTTEKHENSIFLLLFDDEKLFNEYKKKNKSVKKLEKDLDYFKKLINKNKKIEGILVRKTPEDLILKKNQLN